MLNIARIDHSTYPYHHYSQEQLAHGPLPSRSPQPLHLVAPMPLSLASLPVASAEGLPPIAPSPPDATSGSIDQSVGNSDVEGASTSSKIGGRIHPRRAARTPRLIQVPSDFIHAQPVDNRCPIPGCTFILPDGTRQWRSTLQRHIDTHFAKARADWRCCGIPFGDAHAHGHTMTQTNTLVLWPEVGMLTVGGCGEIFSRKDAYARHLKQSKACVGDANGDWVPGNARRARR